MNQKQIIGISSVVGATFLYSFFSIFTRMAGFEIPFFFRCAFMSTVSGLILLMICGLNSGFKKMTKPDLMWVTARSLGGFVGFVGSYLAFYYLPVGTAYFIFYGGATVGGFILGKVMFNEHVTRLKAIALCFGLLGLLMIYSVSFTQGILIWLCWALAGGLGTAIWNVFSKKISGNYPVTQLNALDSLVSAGFTLIVSLIIAEKWVMPGLTTPWVATYLLMAMFLVTGQLMVVGYKYLDAQKASLLMLMEIFFGIIIGNLYFHETLSASTIIGGGLILIASSLPELDLMVKKQRNKNEKRS